jgi:hypothetical protein
MDIVSIHAPETGAPEVEITPAMLHAGAGRLDFGDRGSPLARLPCAYRVCFEAAGQRDRIIERAPPTRVRHLGRAAFEPSQRPVKRHSFPELTCGAAP